MSKDETVEERAAVRGLRWASDHLLLWRVCANAACRRARRCRGRAWTCAERNACILPDGVRDWCIALLAARSENVSWEDFWEDMWESEEAAAFFAWRRLAQSKTRGPRRP